MAEYKDQGNPEFNLLEELAEVMQVIAKKQRFNGNWNEVPPGKTKTRLEQLQDEMSDVLIAYNNLLALNK